VTSFHTCGICVYNNCAAASVHVGTPYNLTQKSKRIAPGPAMVPGLVFHSTKC